MSEAGQAQIFDFYPDWEHLERFLRLYQEADQSGNRTTLRVSVDSEFHQVLPGYPNPRRNAWLTLEYAIQQANRCYHQKNSLVDCLVVDRPGEENE